MVISQPHNQKTDQEENSKTAISLSERFPPPKRANSVEDASFSFPSFLHELFLFGRRKRRDEATKNTTCVKLE